MLKQKFRVVGRGGCKFGLIDQGIIKWAKWINILIQKIWLSNWLFEWSIKLGKGIRP